MNTPPSMNKQSLVVLNRECYIYTADSYINYSFRVMHIQRQITCRDAQFGRLKIPYNTEAQKQKRRPSWASLHKKTALFTAVFQIKSYCVVGSGRDRTLHVVYSSSSSSEYALIT